MEKEKFANDRNLGFSTFKEELEADYPTKKSEEEELKSGLRKKKKPQGGENVRKCSVLTNAIKKSSWWRLNAFDWLWNVWWKLDKQVGVKKGNTGCYKKLEKERKRVWQFGDIECQERMSAFLRIRETWSIREVKVTFINHLLISRLCVWRCIYTYYQVVDTEEKEQRETETLKRQKEG